MKWIVLLALFLITIKASADSLYLVRKDFHGIETEDKLKAFLHKYKSLKDVRAIPYMEAAYMQKAKYAINPIRKLNYFNKGKEALEKFIKQHPRSIEARYVRLLVQSEVPGFLGYDGHMQGDKEFILKELETCSLPEDYKKIIRYNIGNISKNNGS